MEEEDGKGSSWRKFKKLGKGVGERLKGDYLWELRSVKMEKGEQIQKQQRGISVRNFRPLSILLDYLCML